jgi:hypothetical protein
MDYPRHWSQTLPGLHSLPLFRTLAPPRWFTSGVVIVGVVLGVEWAPNRPSLSIGAAAAAAPLVLSNNLHQATEGGELVAGHRWVTASFSTGGSGDLLLDSVTVLMRMAAAGQAQLDLHATGPGPVGQPGGFLASLIAPSGGSSTLAETVFAGNGLALTPNTTYWAVLRAINGDFEWAWTRQLSGAGVGFQGTWGYSDDAGASWDTFATEAMQMSVTAQPVPGPLPLAGAVPALALGRQLRRRRLRATPSRPVAPAVGPRC